MAEQFGNKPFIKHQAQGFEQFPVINSYNAEEESFLKTVQLPPRSQFPHGANSISSHTLYKVKQNYDVALTLKARIAHHGNEDDLKHLLNKDCPTCPPTGLRVLDSISSLCGWTVYNADVKAAFLQTRKAYGDVYVRPSRESGMKATHM